MYKVILFDLDGTLTESGEGITKSVQYALGKLGLPEAPLEELRTFVGPPLLEKFMEYAGLDQDTAKQAVAYYRERYSSVGIFENRVYDGIPEVLEGLQRKGYRLVVASAKPEKYVKQILEHYEIASYFEEVVGSEMDGRRTSKEAVIEEALRRLNLQNHRSQVLMVGDRENDVLGARKCGLECLAVSYGYGSVEELEATDPLKIVSTVPEILDFFC